MALAFLSVLVLGSAAIVHRAKIDFQLALAVLGVLLSFVYFIQKQQIDEAKLFKELFVEFNGRYSEMNEGLNLIVSQPDTGVDLTKPEIDTLYDYFNLCAEEYLFYQKGYIYPEVWASWTEGMNIFFSDPRVNNLWSAEAKTSSYYGLTIGKVKSL